MKREQISAALTGFAVVISVLGLVLSFSEFKSLLDSQTMLVLTIGASAYAAIASVLYSRMQERILRRRRIFIMYSREDLPSAESITKTLRDMGYRPWLDVEEITPGERWAYAAGKGLAESAVALLLVSKNLNLESGFVAKELEVAMAKMRSRDQAFSPVIPVLLDETEVPQQLREVHAVDMSSKQGIDQLGKGLKRILGQA